MLGYLYFYIPFTIESSTKFLTEPNFRQRWSFIKVICMYMPVCVLLKEATKLKCNVLVCCAYPLRECVCAMYNSPTYRTNINNIYFFFKYIYVLFALLRCFYLCAWTSQRVWSPVQVSACSRHQLSGPCSALVQFPATKTLMNSYSHSKPLDPS